MSDGLLKMCESNGVWVSYQPLPKERGQLGMFFRDMSGRPFILLDPSLLDNPRLHRCILAEEVGHFKTTGSGTLFVMHFSYNVALAMSKADAAALRWASEYLMPTLDFARAVKDGRRDVHELAEHFYVTEWMVHRKIQFLRQDLRRRHRLRIKLRDMLSPLLTHVMGGQGEYESYPQGPPQGGFGVSQEFDIIRQGGVWNADVAMCGCENSFPILVDCHWCVRHGFGDVDTFGF